MAQFTLPADVADVINSLKARVAVLERRVQNPVPVFTTTTRPGFAAAPYLVIWNSTTATFQGSTGAAWVNLS